MSEHVNQPLKVLGNRIRERRKIIGWSQELLADKATLDRSYVGGVERGERNISFLTLCLIVQALDCDVAELTAGIPKKITAICSD